MDDELKEVQIDAVKDLLEVAFQKQATVHEMDNLINNNPSILDEFASDKGWLERENERVDNKFVKLYILSIKFFIRFSNLVM